MRYAFMFLLLCCFTVSVHAQKYTTAAGIRVGSGIGLSLQQKLWDSYTAEAILQKSLMKNETYATAMFEQHIKLLAKGLNIYLGAGPHLMLTKMDGTDDKTGLQTSITNTAYGLSAIGGLEMRLKRMVFSVDYLPSVNFNGGANVFGTRTGISARYIFVKAKKNKQNENWKFWKKWKTSKDDDDYDR